MADLEELRERLLRRLEREKQEFTTKSMHLLERPLAADTELAIGPNRYRVSRDAYLVVIDEAPGAYWTHPVRYELHDVETDHVTLIREKYPIEAPDLRIALTALHIPDLPHLKKKEMTLESRGLFQIEPEILRIEQTLHTLSFGLPRPCESSSHALFVAGMDNMPDFHNDFVIMRDILVNRYGYDPGNIVIVMGDGSGYPDLPVDHPGTVAGLDAALDAYATGGARELGPNDTLFLYTFNHGDWEEDTDHVWLCMHPDWDEYHDHQLLAKLDNIRCGDLIVAMNQCHSGGFIPEVTSTTGPNRVTIMTACQADQSAHPASIGSHGYFSVVLYTALNWEFPAAIDPAFAGYVAGAITTHDTNNDGMVSAEEAWHYVHDMMHAHHWYTINGYETPQWGESSAGIGANLFWGHPEIVVEDGSPWWESPDVFLHDPSVVPDDTSTISSSPTFWGDNYHPDTLNRVVARVHNTGCAPCRDVNVEFRVMSFGTGGGTTLIGTSVLDNIDPGHHGFAYVDWNFPSALVHRCIMVRADCPGDPASPFGTPITADDNQAQRNVDPVYVAPGYGEAEEVEEQVIERTFIVRNDFEIEGVFGLSLTRSKFRSQRLRPVTDFQDFQRMTLAPGEEQEITVRFEVSPRARVGDRLHVPIAIRRNRPRQAVVGGISFTVEVARGWLEGILVFRQGIPVNAGTVTIRNIKQPDLEFSAEVSRRGFFSFKNIAPGPYHIMAEHGWWYTRDSVFVEPNRVTKKVILARRRTRIVGGVLKDRHGNLLAHQLVMVEDPDSGVSYLVRTNEKGQYQVSDIRPGEYEISIPDKEDIKPQKVRLDFLVP